MFNIDIKEGTELYKLVVDFWYDGTETDVPNNGCKLFWVICGALMLLTFLYALGFIFVVMPIIVLIGLIITAALDLYPAIWADTFWIYVGTGTVTILMLVIYFGDSGCRAISTWWRTIRPQKENKNSNHKSDSIISVAWKTAHSKAKKICPTVTVTKLEDDTNE